MEKTETPVLGNRILGVKCESSLVATNPHAEQRYTKTPSICKYKFLLSLSKILGKISISYLTFYEPKINLWHGKCGSKPKSVILRSDIHRVQIKKRIPVC